VYDAVTWSAITPLSEKSIQQNGASVDFLILPMANENLEEYFCARTTPINLIPIAIGIKLANFQIDPYLALLFKT